MRDLRRIYDAGPDTPAIPPEIAEEIAKKFKEADRFDAACRACEDARDYDALRSALGVLEERERRVWWVAAGAVSVDEARNASIGELLAVLPLPAALVKIAGEFGRDEAAWFLFGRSSRWAKPGQKPTTKALLSGLQRVIKAIA